MRTYRNSIIVLMLVLGTLLFAQGATEELTAPPMETQTQSHPILTAQEVEGILLMREEEKLAHDVYMTLYEKWQIPVFANIAASEATHYQAMGDLIDLYDLEDPSEGMAEGEFSSPELQELYEQLIASGSTSALEALKTGALIEDLDIADLQELIDQTEEEQIIFTYSNLLKGSVNHIRAFTSQLSRYKVEYEPVYISDEELRTFTR